MTAGENSYFLLRLPDGSLVLYNDCCDHRGAPLHLGHWNDVRKCLVCPWHATKYSEKVLRSRATPLTEDARIVPCAAKVYAMVVESPHLHSLNTVGMAAGFDVSLINRYATPQYFPIRLAAFDYTPLTDRFEVFHFDFANGTIIPTRKTISVRAQRDGTSQCVIFWFDMQLDQKISISNEPGSTTHWEQALQCLEQEVPVRAGEMLTAEAEHDCNVISFKVCAGRDQIIASSRDM